MNRGVLPPQFALLGSHDERDESKRERDELRIERDEPMIERDEPRREREPHEEFPFLSALFIARNSPPNFIFISARTGGLTICGIVNCML